MLRADYYQHQYDVYASPCQPYEFPTTLLQWVDYISRKPYEAYVYELQILHTRDNVQEAHTWPTFPESISTGTEEDGSVSFQRLVMYIHNLPEHGRDEELVSAIVVAANIPGVDDIVLKRVKSKAKWWGGVHLPWRKMNQHPEALKIKMKITEENHMPKATIMEKMQNTVFCMAFNIQVTETHEGTLPNVNGASV